MTGRRRIRVSLYRPPWWQGRPYFRAQQVMAHFRGAGDRVRLIAGPRGWWRSLVRLLLWPWQVIWADLIFLYPQPLMPLFALTAGWLGRRVVVDHFVSYLRLGDVSPRLGRWLDAAERDAYRRADAVLAHTASMADGLKSAFGLADDRLRTLYCVVDPGHFSPIHGERAAHLRRQLGLDGRFVVLYHGRGHPWHGLDTLREAVASLAQADALGGAGNRPVALVLIGREEGAAPHERVLGEVAYDDLPGYIQMADVWCSGFANLPRGDRSLSSTMIQAMALARPVITSPSPEKSRWLRDGETALFVPPDDARALAKAIERCRREPEQARAVGDAGRRLVQGRFDIVALHQLLEGLARTWFGG